MKYIQIRKDEIYTSGDAATLNRETMQWEPAKPELYDCNLKEWFIHNILKKHFTFGQPYCVVCGYAEVYPQGETNL
jgi:hypothetical protein